MQRAALALVAVLALQPDTRPVFVVPNMPDLTISTRLVVGSRVMWRQTFLYKGGRFWHRRTHEGQPSDTVAEYLTQCDRRRALILNPQQRLYASRPLPEPEADRFPPAAMDGRLAVRQSATHHIIIDAVDTGERKTFAGLTARHVVTTTTETWPDRAATQVEDGWYVDLPPLDCIDRAPVDAVLTGSVGEITQSLEVPTITRRGQARRGFPLIETTRRVDPAGGVVQRIELVDISNRPIDPSRFEVPNDYRPALPLPHGGVDLTRPDTLINRAWAAWERARDLAARFWW